MRTASELHRHLSFLGDSSYSQVVRLAQERPTHLNLELLAGIVSELGCKLGYLLVLQEDLEIEHLKRVAAVSKTWGGLSGLEKAVLRQHAATD